MAQLNLAPVPQIDKTMLRYAAEVLKAMAGAHVWEFITSPTLREQKNMMELRIGTPEFSRDVGQQEWDWWESLRQRIFSIGGVDQLDDHVGRVLVLLCEGVASGYRDDASILAAATCDDFVKVVREAARRRFTAQAEKNGDALDGSTLAVYIDTAEKTALGRLATVGLRLLLERSAAG